MGYWDTLIDYLIDERLNEMEREGESFDGDNSNKE